MQSGICFVMTNVTDKAEIIFHCQKRQGKDIPAGTKDNKRGFKRIFALWIPRNN